MSNWLLLGWMTLGCANSTPIDHQTYTVACGMCIFELGSSSGCYWAAEVDGGYLPVTGTGVPLEHDSHGPGGMCTMPRQAVITGTLHDDKIFADVFELVPVRAPGPGKAHAHKH